MTGEKNRILILGLDSCFHDVKFYLSVMKLICVIFSNSVND